MAINRENTSLEKVFSMKGGKDEGSYFKNSQAQARHALRIFPLLEATLKSMQLPKDTSSFIIADLGCSCSANTLHNVGTIIKFVKQQYHSLGCTALPDFQVYLSDLPSNDFNVLFQLLPPLSITGTDDGSEEGIEAVNKPRSYFAAAVPGSFYGRLFPGASVNVFNSTFSLHWLSQVPRKVRDKESSSYNKGRVFIHGAPKSVTDAYKEQFEKDMTKFLVCRGQEMKRGGVMFLAFVGRASADPSEHGGAGLLFGTHFQDAWNDLVYEGLIESEKLDSFNIPLYAPSLEEFREVVEANGMFSINQLELVKGGIPFDVSHPDDAAEVGRALANSCRSVTGVLVEAQIGDELSGELFSRLEHRAANHAEEIMKQLQFFHIVTSLSFIDKTNT